MKYVCKKALPSLRLSNTEYDPRLQSQGSINVGVYTCPVCSNDIRFKTTDFQRHLGGANSNLGEALSQAITEYRQLDQQKWESFLDFSCATCNLHVRIIYEPFEFAMGAYSFTVTDVVECNEVET